MPSVDHALEIAEYFRTDCAEINMNKHKERKDVTRNDMYHVGDMDTAFAEDLRWDILGEKQGKPGEQHERHQEIHRQFVTEQLHRVELSLHSDRKGWFLFFKDAHCIILELLAQPPEQPFPNHLVVFTVFSEYIPQKENDVCDDQDDARDVVD